MPLENKTVLPGFSTELWNCSSRHASKAGAGLRLGEYGDIRLEVPITHNVLQCPLGVEVALAGARGSDLLLTARVQVTEARWWASAAQQN
jgi:hypothetical protein